MKLFPLKLCKKKSHIFEGCSQWLCVLICTYLCLGKSDKIYCTCISDCVKCRECRVEVSSLVYGVLKFPTALKLVHFTAKLYYFLSLTNSESQAQIWLYVRHNVLWSQTQNVQDPDCKKKNKKSLSCHLVKAQIHFQSARQT